MFKFYRVYDVNDKSRFCMTGACRKEVAIDSCKDLFEKDSNLKAVWCPLFIEKIQMRIGRIKKFFK